MAEVKKHLEVEGFEKGVKKFVASCLVISLDVLNLIILMHS